MKDPDLAAKAIYYQLTDLFEISAIYSHGGRLLFRARPYFEKEEAIARMRSRLRQAGMEVDVREDQAGLLIAVKETSVRKIPWVNLVLFLLTLVTVFLAPVFWESDMDILLKPARLYAYLDTPGVTERSLEFAVSLMLILLFHEFGHYLAGRRRGVLMSLPYFLPGPNMAGTFGAIIKSRSPITNRRDLIEVGATGPIAGFVVSVIALAVGLHGSQIIMESQVAGLSLGDSLLMKFLAWVIIGPIPEGYTFALSPAAFAGWVGLLVTMLNLLPLGQLDGGHIVYALFGRSQHRIGRMFFVLMMALGFWWPGWWFFGVLVFLFGITHPPTVNDAMALPRSAKIMGIAAIIIFIISFIPIPFGVL